MSVPFQLDIVLDRKTILQNLQKLSEKFGSTDLESWMKNHLVAYLHLRTSNRFANEGDDAVGKWDALEPVTEVIRAGKGYSPAHPINVRTGDLKSFMLSNDGDFTATGSGAQLDYPSTPPSAELFEKLATAQTGKQNPRTPMRPVIALGPTDVADIHALFEVFIKTGLI